MVAACVYVRSKTYLTGQGVYVRTKTYLSKQGVYTRTETYLTGRVYIYFNYTAKYVHTYGLYIILYC